VDVTLHRPDNQVGNRQSLTIKIIRKFSGLEKLTAKLVAAWGNLFDNFQKDWSL